ncbi:MAG: hypothetical protein H6Q18_479 [Bacteroidetes bacterium]|nr:hypothetical protein [Bacteroidota bacterium]
MRKIYIIALLFCVFSAKGEVIDTIHLKCSYQYTFLKDTINKISSNDLLVLQIGKKLSKCYSYYTFQSDSISSTPEGRKIWGKLFGQAIEKNGSSAIDFPHRRLSTFVYKNYPKNEMTITDNISLSYYVYEDSLNNQNWRMEDSIKKIIGYNCQKAECDFRGRHWTAWFTPDIPISDGPWKFSGLPGLILEAYDDNKQYYFGITGIQKENKKLITFSTISSRGIKSEQTDRKRFIRSLRNYLSDVSEYTQMETGIDLGGNISNKKIKYDLIERDY